MRYKCENCSAVSPDFENNQELAKERKWGGTMRSKRIFGRHYCSPSDGWNDCTEVGSPSGAQAVIEECGADPKSAHEVSKDQLQLIPPALNSELAKVLSSGAAKYGFWNWRGNKVELMTYIGAMRRHIDALIDGEDVDPESGAHHLGHVAANCAIVLDAKKSGSLVDNRPKRGKQ